MIERYRIVKGPSGYNVEGFFNVTWKRSFFESLFGFPRGIYGWHLLDMYGSKWYVSIHMPIITRAAVFESEEKARAFIAWQKSRGEIITV